MWSGLLFCSVEPSSIPTHIARCTLSVKGRKLAPPAALSVEICAVCAARARLALSMANQLPVRWDATPTAVIIANAAATAAHIALYHVRVMGTRMSVRVLRAAGFNDHQLLGCDVQSALFCYSCCCLLADSTIQVYTLSQTRCVICAIFRCCCPPRCSCCCCSRCCLLVDVVTQVYTLSQRRCVICATCDCSLLLLPLLPAC
jgi:hypothetical protein